MNTDQLAPDGEDLQLDVTEQVTDEAPAAETPEAPVNPIEAIAAEKGWVPQDKWRGEGEWRSAEDFVRHGLERAREGKDQIRELRKTVDRIARTSDAIEKRNIAEAVAQAEERMRQAVADNDPDAVLEASRALHRAEAQATQPPAAIDDFKSRNPWFGTNTEATVYAQSIAGIHAERGADAATQIAEAEKAVLKRFPELSGAPVAREPVKQPASVSPPTARTAPSVGRAKGFGDLPREAQQVGRDFLAKGRIKTLDDYAKAYYEENA